MLHFLYSISFLERLVKRAKLLYELRAKQHATSEKLKELEKPSGKTWVQIKFMADQIWDDLKGGIAEAY